MSFKGYSIFSSGGHFVRWRGTIVTILVEGHLRNMPVKYACEIILKSGLWPRRRCHLKVFLFLALVAILFSGAKPFQQFW